MYHNTEKSRLNFEKVDEEAVNSLKKAGKIAAEALQYGKTLIKKGESVLAILDKVEAHVLKLDGNFAFPPQISLNDTAAHNCPDHDDKVILDEDVVKLDVGVHINGYIADNALTVDLSGKWKDLVKVNREALDAALKLAVPGTKLAEIGKAIQEIIQSAGYSPVRNLSGHGLGQFKVHTRPSIPNFDTGDKTELQEGMVIAIEPFASAGAGIVYESGEAGVFSLINSKPVRDLITRNVLAEINGYQGLPFAKKWLTRKFGLAKVNYAIKQLEKLEAIHGYPPLVDQNHGVVSQAEESVIVMEKPVYYTRV